MPSSLFPNNSGTKREVINHEPTPDDLADNDWLRPAWRGYTTYLGDLRRIIATPTSRNMFQSTKEKANTLLAILQRGGGMELGSGTVLPRWGPGASAREFREMIQRELGVAKGWIRDSKTKSATKIVTTEYIESLEDHRAPGDNQDRTPMKKGTLYDARTYSILSPSLFEQDNPSIPSPISNPDVEPRRTGSLYDVETYEALSPGLFEREDPSIPSPGREFGDREQGQHPGFT